MPGTAWKDRLRGRWAVLLLVAPVVLAACLGLGARWPLLFELLGLTTAVLLCLLTRFRLAGGGPPSSLQLGLALGGGQALALAIFTGGRWTALHPGLERLRWLSPLAGLLALAVLGALAALPRSSVGGGEREVGPDLAPRARPRLLIAAPALLAGLAGLGAHWPLAFELLGAVTIAALCVLAWDRLRRGPPPLAIEVLLGLIGVQLMALAVLVGGHAAGLHAGIEPVCRRMSLVAAFLSACALGALAALPQLRAWWGEGSAADPGQAVAGVAAPPAGAGRVAVLVTWLAFHLPVLLMLPPLVQFDSWTNVLEPDLFVPTTQPFHHPPLYVELIKAASRAPSLLLGLTVVVALQHALVLGMALLLEDFARRLTRNAWIGVAVGCGVALEQSLILYAQLVMSEILGATFLVLALVALCSAEERDAPSVRRLLAAGAFAALATLTRQVMQAWFAFGLLWLLTMARLRGRARAAAAFTGAALLPVLLLVAHHYVFQGTPRLTAAMGRSLTARLTDGMPSLSDPSAPPGDELERARQAIWRTRHTWGSWTAVHAAVRDELGWDEERIAAVVQRFYWEQVRRHPVAFARVTLRGQWAILSGGERFADVARFHDQVLDQAYAGWHVLPRVGPPPAWTAALDRLALTQRWPVLLLAALAPLLARGRARRVGLLAVLTVLYVTIIPALFEQPLARYRLPAAPLIALAAGLATGGVLQRLGQRPASADQRGP